MLLFSSTLPPGRDLQPQPRSDVTMQASVHGAYRILHVSLSDRSLAPTSKGSVSVGSREHPLRSDCRPPLITCIFRQFSTHLARVNLVTQR
jgi:hypothetical protein